MVLVDPARTKGEHALRTRFDLDPKKQLAMQQPRAEITASAAPLAVEASGGVGPQAAAPAAAMNFRKFEMAPLPEVPKFQGTISERDWPSSQAYVPSHSSAVEVADILARAKKALNAFDFEAGLAARSHDLDKEESNAQRQRVEEIVDQYSTTCRQRQYLLNEVAQRLPDVRCKT